MDKVGIQPDKHVDERLHGKLRQDNGTQEPKRSVDHLQRRHLRHDRLEAIPAQIGTNACALAFVEKGVLGILTLKITGFFARLPNFSGRRSQARYPAPAARNHVSTHSKDRQLC